MEKDWKLRLRYGKIKTVFSHFTLIVDVESKGVKEFECPDGNAVMSMKCWVSDSNEAVEMVQNIGSEVGFKVIGRIEIYKTEPESPPMENPYGYDIRFVPYDE